MAFDDSISVAEMAQAMGLPQGTIDRLSPTARQLTKQDLVRAMGASNGPEALEKYQQDPSAGAAHPLDLSVEDVRTIQDLFSPAASRAPGEGAQPRDFNCCCCAPCCCSAAAMTDPVAIP